MNIVDFIGIFVIECPSCKQRYIIDTAKLQAGNIEFYCTCKRHIYHTAVHGITVSINGQNMPPRFYGEDTAKYVAQNSKDKQPVPIEEYKAMLADYVLNGKVKKIPKQYKNSVNFPDDKQYQDMLETLLSLGYKRQDAISKIQIALEQGIRMEQDLIKYILDL